MSREKTLMVRLFSWISEIYVKSLTLWKLLRKMRKYQILVLSKEIEKGCIEESIDEYDQGNKVS